MLLNTFIIIKCLICIRAISKLVALTCYLLKTYIFKKVPFLMMDERSRLIFTWKMLLHNPHICLCIFVVAKHLLYAHVIPITCHTISTLRPPMRGA